MQPNFETAYTDATTPGENWDTYTGPETETSGLFITLDYTSAGFSKTPMVIANLVGSADNWVMQVTVTEITTTTAKVYIRSTLPDYSPTTTDAGNQNWHIVYFAFEPAGSSTYTFPPMTYATVVCDNA